MIGARFPPGRLGRERLRDGIPPTPRSRCQRPGDGRQRGLMGQEIAHREPRLATLGELGPVASDRRVEIEQARLDEAERADGADRLPDRVEVDDRVAFPGSRPRRIGVAAPQVDDRTAVDVDGQRRAHLETGGEDLGERVADSFERRLAVSVYDQARVPSIARVVHLE